MGRIKRAPAFLPVFILIIVFIALQASCGIRRGAGSNQLESDDDVRIIKDVPYQLRGNPARPLISNIMLFWPFFNSF